MFRKSSLRFWLLSVWACAIAGGFATLYWHAFAINSPNRENVEWPRSTSLLRSEDRVTLVMFAHPKCPCTMASLYELERIVREANCCAKVVFWQPASVDESDADGWSNSPTIRFAKTIPATQVLFDSEGVETKRFQVETSGYCIAFAPNGNILFSGGLTSSRGHEGATVGGTRLIQQITNHALSETKICTPAFGCSIYANSSEQL